METKKPITALTPEQVEFNDLCKAARMKPAEIARRLNYKPSNFSKIKAGLQQPSPHVLTALRYLVRSIQEGTAPPSPSELRDALQEIQDADSEQYLAVSQVIHSIHRNVKGKTSSWSADEAAFALAENAKLAAGIAPPGPERSQKADAPTEHKHEQVPSAGTRNKKRPGLPTKAPK